MISHKDIILDCDPGEDDALAILLALSRNLNVAGLVCGFGNASAEKTYKNGAGLLALAGRTDVSLFKGAEKAYRPHPLEKDTVEAGDFVGENGLCGAVLPPVPEHLTVYATQTQEQRIDGLVRYLRKNAPLTYIVTGPCVTLAHVLDSLGDEARDIIQQVIVMGGALDTPGNQGPINPETGKSYAEFNFYCDPHAVARVLESGLPITLVPWDLTERIVLTYGELALFAGNTPGGEFVIDLMRRFLESYGNANARSFEFNDCITITAFEGEGRFNEEHVRVLTEGEQAGRLVRDAEHGTRVQFFDLEPSNIRPTRDGILSSLGISVSSTQISGEQR